MLLDALQCADLRDFIRMQEDAVGCRKWGNQPILGPWKSSRFFPEFGQKKSSVGWWRTPFLASSSCYFEGEDNWPGCNTPGLRLVNINTCLMFVGRVICDLYLESSLNYWGMLMSQQYHETPKMCHSPGGWGWFWVAKTEIKMLVKLVKKHGNRQIHP